MGVYRKNSAWWIDYYCQSRRYRQKIGSRRKDAEEAFSRIKVQIAAGEFVPPQERRRLESLERHSALPPEDRFPAKGRRRGILSDQGADRCR